MTRPEIIAEFIPSTRGEIFGLARAPARPSGQCVLIVPPFAEEMNKSRRMIASLAAQLSTRGVGSVIVDFFGTGDSAGDFSEASCERWLEDLNAADRWVADKGWTIDSMLGIRLGAILGMRHAATRSLPLRKTVFWQPALDGARVLEQFLRLRVAASLMSDKKETTSELLGKLEAGENVDVAGYSISGDLARGLRQLKLLEVCGAHAANITWIEVLRTAELSPPPPTLKAIEQLRGSNVDVSLQTCVGEAFWNSTEIVCLPEMLAATVNALVPADGR